MESPARKQWRRRISKVGLLWRTTGDFVSKQSSKFRALRRQGNDRMMELVNIPAMEDWVIVGHLNCAASYVQSSTYEGQDVEANVQFVETQVQHMNPLASYKYIQVVAIREIKKGETLFAKYRGAAAVSDDEELDSEKEELRSGDDLPDGDEPGVAPPHSIGQLARSCSGAVNRHRQPRPSWVLFE